MSSLSKSKDLSRSLSVPVFPEQAEGSFTGSTGIIPCRGDFSCLQAGTGSFDSVPLCCTPLGMTKKGKHAVSLPCHRKHSPALSSALLHSARDDKKREACGFPSCHHERSPALSSRAQQRTRGVLCAVEGSRSLPVPVFPEQAEGSFTGSPGSIPRRGDFSCLQAGTGSFDSVPLCCTPLRMTIKREACGLPSLSSRAQPHFVFRSAALRSG